MNLTLRTVNVTRYITPLREGGSLPALAEADDDFKYVLKFRGAGHGVKALIAEFLGGQIARYLGLPVPELVFANLDEAFGRTEADEEIQDLLQFSQGLNLGLHYLSGAITYDAATNDCDATLASKIVWLDAFITNVDRTFKNTNLLIWKKELWLIDHGAAFYFHHSWDNWQANAISPFALIKDHVLLPKASKLEEVRKEMKYLDMGDGPNYILYRPYHLCSLETPLSAAKAVIDNEATIAPMGGLVSEVITIAKKDMKAGEKLDGIGGYTVYGSVEVYETAKEANALPVGLITKNTTLTKDVKKGDVITYDMVQLDETSFILQLRRIQDKLFG